jgi:hypothetical protein
MFGSEKSTAGDVTVSDEGLHIDTHILSFSFMRDCEQIFLTVSYLLRILDRPEPDPDPKPILDRVRVDENDNLPASFVLYFPKDEYLLIEWE